MFNVDYEMELLCDYDDCRKRVRASDYDTHAAQWDADAIEALKFVRQVDQPLWEVMDPATRRKLEHYLNTGDGYVPAVAQRVQK